MPIDEIMIMHSASAGSVITCSLSLLSITHEGKPFMTLDFFFIFLRFKYLGMDEIHTIFAFDGSLNNGTWLASVWFLPG